MVMMENNDVDYLMLDILNEKIDSLQKQIDYCNARLGAILDPWERKEFNAVLLQTTENWKEAKERLENWI